MKHPNKLKPDSNKSLFLVVFFVAVMCIFEEQPGSTFGVFNTFLDIPCVTNTEAALVFWYKVIHAGEIATENGVPEMFQDKYYLTRSGSTSFSLGIKHVGWSEPRYWCKVFVRNSDETYEPFASSESNITTVGELYISIHVLFLKQIRIW